MSTPKFYELQVADVRPETAECVSVAFEVPEDLKTTFQYIPGQYLTLRTNINGNEIRRSYSICTAPSENELRVAIKQVDGGKFSTYANTELKKGDRIDVMNPMGNFSPKASEKTAKNYLAFVAGSGITPVMSIVRHILATEPESNFTLVYGNKNRNTIIFKEAIEGLKNLYINRLSVYHVLSREIMDVPLFNGRITAEKCGEFCDALIDIKTIDEVFLCGPEDMILSVREKLTQAGLQTSQIHLELFSSPDQPQHGHEEWKKEHSTADGPVSKVSVRIDGATFEMDLPYNGDNILDAALNHGADLPFACKGGVCSTCRAKVVEGTVEMEVNYALEPSEVKRGYILTCQSHPTSERVVVDYDAR